MPNAESIAVVVLTIGSVLGVYAGPQAQRAPVQTAISPQTSAELRQSDRVVDQMLRTDGLVRRQVRLDTLLSDRVHERLEQRYEGLRVFGADVTRETMAGMTQSLFGTLYDVVDVEPTPRLTAEEALTVVRDVTGDDFSSRAPAELLILPIDSTFALAYRLSAASTSQSADFFVDAHSGALLLTISTIHTAAAVGLGTGVLGDTKKVSDNSSASGFTAVDLLRPPSIRTYDMRGNLPRVKQFQQGVVRLTDADLASTSTSNSWTDPAVVDAHAYAGMVYDFYFKRFGRHGLDDNDIPLVSLVHPVLRTTALTASAGDSIYYTNAFWDSALQVMVYGDGLPPGVVVAATQQTWNYTSGALDIIGHELTHGVTQFTSNLIYRNESGALNESFSDMMGTSAEFFSRSTGTGTLQADYVIGADVIRGPLVNGIRSMANPLMFGDPDHYSRRSLAASDAGGVHANAGIPNNAFYLAIEGGTNRTSGLSVQGVGASNREQIEMVFYRAFAFLLPSGATFSLARAATIQSARDLYGIGSSAERAVTQAWTAVGVN
ncbi:MAG: M4 family metallopeptidase [Acidobacteriota bacterium]